MGNTTAVRVVVVHWNQPRDCLETVGSLLASTVPVAVTVVDNASRPADRAELSDGLARLGGIGWGSQDEQPLQEAHEIIDAPVNLGFGPGANLGLARFLGDPGDGEWVFLVPHDVEVEPDTIEQMLQSVAGVPAAGLCCADVGDAMVPVMDPYFGGMVVPAGTPPGVTGPVWEPVDYPHGTLMALRRGCLHEIGTFDERYFSYCEEADLGLRARRRGWAVGLVRGAMVRNRDLGSPVWMVDYLQTRNTLLLVSEASGRYHAFIRVCFTLAQVLRGLADPTGRPPVFDAGARLSGVWDFLRGRFGPPPRPRSVLS